MPTSHEIVSFHLTKVETWGAVVGRKAERRELGIITSGQKRQVRPAPVKLQTYIYMPALLLGTRDPLTPFSRGIDLHSREMDEPRRYFAQNQQCHLT